MNCDDLTHWGRVTHICVGNLTIIGPDNGLLPGRRQAIICTNAGILSIGPLGTNFSEIQIGIQTVSYKKMHLKMSSVKWRPFCLGLNVLTRIIRYQNDNPSQWPPGVMTHHHCLSYISDLDISFEELNKLTHIVQDSSIGTKSFTLYRLSQWNNHVGYG